MRKPLRFFLSPLPLLLLCSLCLHLFRPTPAVNSKPYSIFIGLEVTDLKRLHPYRTVVIKPSSFSTEQIKTLQAEGKSVYDYLNLDSLENYHPYYERFASPILTPYENRLSECWADIPSPAWQTFVVDEFGGTCTAPELGGFFLNNCDVYTLYPHEGTFNELTTMLCGLSRYRRPCIINGGDVFVSTCIENGFAHTFFDDANQESIFTKTDFAKDRYATQDTETRACYLDYLTCVKGVGLKVYLIEYRPTAKLAAEIQDYYEKSNFTTYNANGKKLRQAAP